jgi:hypothetical protein
VTKTKTYTPPATDEEALEMRRALASFERDKVQTIVDYLNSPAVKAVVEKLNELAATRMPAGTSVATSVPTMARNFAAFAQQAQEDVNRLSHEVDPVPAVADANLLNITPAPVQ